MTPERPPIHHPSAPLLLTPCSQVQILLDSSFQLEGCERGWEGLGQLKSIKPTINLHKKQKRTPSPILQPPTKKEIQGLKKLMRSQKTEVIQVQCANRGTGGTEKKQNNTRPIAFNSSSSSLWTGALQASNSVPLRTWLFPLSSPGLGSPGPLCSKGPQDDSTIPSSGSYPDPGAGCRLVQVSDTSGEGHPHASLGQ